MKAQTAIALLVVLLGSVSGLWAQHWTLQSPLPLAAEMECATFIDPLHGWAGNEWGDMIRTTDGGLHWDIVNLQTDERWISSISFTDPLNGWATGSNNCLIHTTDGGITWHDQAAGPRRMGQFIWFTSPLNGWLISERVEHTLDGGESWQTLRILNESFINEQASFVLDSAHVWIVLGYPSCLLRTADAGATWDSTNLSSAGFKWATDLFFIDALHGWMTTNEYDDDEILLGARVLNTTDGGATWTTQYTSTSGLMKAVRFADPNRGVAGGGNYCLTTTDGGRNWETHHTYNHHTMTALAGLPNGQFWSFYAGGIIRASTDYGLHWQPQSSGAASGEWTAMTASDTRHVWVAGQWDIMRTTNGGAQWQIMELNNPSALIEDMAAVDSSNIWVSTRDYRGRSWINYSADGGETWTPQFTDSVGYITDLSFTDRSHGWAATDLGIYNTIDGGFNWTRQLQRGEIGEVFFIDWLHGWAVGSQQQLLRTIDGGRTWLEFWASYAGFFDLVFTDLMNGWVATIYQGTLLHTTNGGVSWEAVHLPGWLWVTSLMFTDALHGYASGYSTTDPEVHFVGTTDGGVTWQVLTDYPEGVTAMAFPQPDTGWLAAGNGRIYHTSPEQATEHGAPSARPNAFGLSAYPNPFNPTTTLQLTVPVAGRTTIGIYDITGRLVQLLADRRLEAGRHTLTFDASALPSGIYFARARGAASTVTQKLMLLK